ncbi:hypothetical protein [Olivibacter jilunii]|uniref:hypothetical protein n=1 Tax=Olivibacter jilunii TaxID=985016 RepID=UPI0010300DB5|nr:hypothetical protein [Olivibacter jilunii]
MKKLKPMKPGQKAKILIPADFKMIADTIRKNWDDRLNEILPLIDMMETLTSIDERFPDGYTGRQLVTDFLAYSKAWKGRIAQAVKEKLIELLDTQDLNNQ